jgi:hypothetical protein
MLNSSAKQRTVVAQVGGEMWFIGGVELIYDSKFKSEDYHDDIIPSNEIAAPAKQGSPHHWKFSMAHTGSRIAQGFQHSVCL